jgi:hypothetical protein
MEEVIMNSLALTFLYTVDELLFAISSSTLEAKWIEQCSPVTVNFGPRFGKVNKYLPPWGIIAFLGLATFSLVRFSIFHEEAREIADAMTCFCQKEGDRCLSRQFMVYKDHN